MIRSDGRAADQLRRIQFEIDYTMWAEGSVLACFGDTQVLCNATLEDSLPGWLRRSGSPHGWVTAEYAMLPRSTKERVSREQRWPRGRTQEISRLIGRSLRMAVDLELLGQRQLIVDCDVLQADGGTRTVAVTGSWLAIKLALQPLIKQGKLSPKVLSRQLAAVSVGIVDDLPLLDLDYREDVHAEVDLNVVMTAGNAIVELQGTAEAMPFSRDRLDQLVDLAAGGIQKLIQHQRRALAEHNDAA